VSLKITEGAIGPGEVLELVVAAPTGIDLTAVTRAIAVSLRTPTGAVETLSPWTTVSTTATAWTVRFSPSGTQFDQLGVNRLIPDVTLDGTLYRYAEIPLEVVRR
jgi:hypothetical protein